MRKLIRYLVCVLVLCLSIGMLAVPASAADTQNLTALLSAGTIKPLGRTQVNAAGDGITADWSGSGFDVNVSGGGILTVGYKASYSNYWAVLVDGVQIWRGYVASGTGTFSAEIPTGEHTVRVVKETQISTTTSAYSMLTTLAYDGTITGAPAQKELYVEFIGDSYSCGDGAIGTYTPGVKWLAEEDSATHGFPYYTAQELDADYSIVARGGIGLYTGVSAEEGTWNAVSMPGIYQNVSGYNSDNGSYSFSRQPDVVVVELGANDGVNATKKAEWTGLMKAFVKVVREKNPDASILLTSHTPITYTALMDVVEQLQEEDANTYAKLHTFFYDFLGTGSAALATQYAGHIGVDDNIAFGKALANFIRSEDLILTQEETATYNEIAYYVSENGNDSGDGKTAGTAKQSLASVYGQIEADHSTFAANDRIVIYVNGTVQTDAQSLSGTKLFCTGDATRVPVVLTGASATIAVDATDAIQVCNDLTFEGITLHWVGQGTPKLYASGCSVVFDNAKFTAGDAAQKWIVAADPAAVTKGSGTITFRNGDYTNLDHVTAVNEDANDSYPDYHAALIIEDGAKMGTVIGRVGTMAVGSAKVEIHGGEVAQYVGTANGTDASRKTYTGDVNLLITGGHIGGSHFSTAGKYATIDGDINTTISGGIFSIVPTGNDGQYEGYFFGGNQKCTVDNINTTISGGQFYLFFDVAADSGFYFGVSGSGTVGNVTNKISEGAFLPIDRAAKGKNCGVYLGCHVGSITGTLTNELSGGNFVMWLASASDKGVCAGSRGVNLPIGKIVNVIGSEGSDHGPTFVGGTVRLAAGWAQVGVSSKSSAMPAVSDCSDAVVVSNTIYGGEFNDAVLYMGATSAPNLDKGYYSFIKGSIENNIYGGFFMKEVYGAGNCPVYGHVTTNIYDGHFKSVYGGAYSATTIYDGVELNIYGMQEYYPVAPATGAGWVICAGNDSGNLPTPQTAGRDAIRLVIDPKQGSELTLNTTVETGAADGTVSAAVRGGKFRRDPTALLDKDNAYCVESITHDSLNYQVVKGFQSAGEFIDFGSSLDLTLYLQADSNPAPEGYSVTVVQNKEGQDVALAADRVSVQAGTGDLAGKLLVTAHGIAAKEMRDELTVTVTKDGETLYTDTLSISEVAQAWYDGATSKAYRTMLADMLNYGRAAQDAFDYNKSDMGEEMATSTNPDWGAVDSDHGVTKGYEDKVATTLSLKEQIELNVYVNDAEAAVSNVTFIPDGEGEQRTLVENTDFFVEDVPGTNVTRIKFNQINVVDAKGTVKFTVELGADKSFEVKYGIKDYVIQALEDEGNTQKELLVALQKYVDSVSVYLRLNASWVTPGVNETNPVPIEAIGSGI